MSLVRVFSLSAAFQLIGAPKTWKSQVTVYRSPAQTVLSSIPALTNPAFLLLLLSNGLTAASLLYSKLRVTLDYFLLRSSGI